MKCSFTNRGRCLATLTLLSAALLLLPLAPVRALVNDQTPSDGWRPSSGIVYAMARVGNMVVLGGTFTRMVSPTGATATRNRLAALDATTGELLPWNPNSNGTVQSLAGSPDSSTVYVGGTFTTVGGASRVNLAALSAMSGLATAFRADTTGTVRALLPYDGGLFVGGSFGRVNTTTRWGAAEVDPATGSVRGWNPNTGAAVYAIAPASTGSDLFIGGPFRTVGGQRRDFTALVTRTTGSPLAWASGSTCQDSANLCATLDIIPTADTVYLGVAGPGGRVVALDTATGRQKWWSGTDGDIQTIALDGKKIYAGGHFEQAVNGTTRAGLVALDASSGAVLPELSTPVYGPSGGSGVWKVLRDGDTFRFAGQFTNVGTTTIARYSTYGISPDPVDGTPPGQVGSLRAFAALADGVSLSWAAASDNVATVAYRILRDGVPIGQSATTQFRDTAVTPSTTYSYTVQAIDFSGNVGIPSRVLTVTTEPARPVLLRHDATWSIFSQGKAPDAGWQGPSFTEVNWSSGVGEFGYGDGDENTLVAPLGVAHYFRMSFDVADPARVDSATLRLRLDDGAVVYINGQEAVRTNMPTGPVTNDTRAVDSLSGAAEATYSSYPIPVGMLVTGRNQIAIEVHNSSTSSSDVSMDAFMTYVESTTPTAPPTPTGLQADPGLDSVALAWSPTAGADSYLVLRDGVQVGAPSTPSFTDSGLSPATTYQYTVRAVNAVGVGPASAPLTVTTDTPPAPAPDSAPANLTVTGTTGSSVTLTWDPVDRAGSYQVWRDGAQVGSVATTTFTDVGLLGTTSYSYTVRAANDGGPGPMSDPVVATTTATPISRYVVSGDTWRVNDSGTDLGTAWREVAFDDTSWRTGPTQIGYGDGDEKTLLNWGTNANAKPITYYARTTFDAGGSISDVTGLSLRAIIDDGAVVYLNGTEVWRFNLPTGTITSTTRASTALSGTAESTWRTASLGTGALRPGLNTIAVEVHNDSPSSSDISMDLELSPVR